MPSSVIRRLGFGRPPQHLPSLARPGIVGKPPNIMMSPASPEFGAVADQIAFRAAIGVSGTWFSANDPVAVPFTLSTTETVYQLGWWNGSGTMTDSVDVGIYTTSWVKLVSTGGTARSGTSAPQFVDVTDTVLQPAKYFLAMSSNGVTANNSWHWAGSASALVWAMGGVQDSATDAYPLPDPLTNMAAAATTTFVPVMLVSFRTLV